MHAGRPCTSGAPLINPTVTGADHRPPRRDGGLPTGAVAAAATEGGGREPGGGGRGSEEEEGCGDGEPPAREREVRPCSLDHWCLMLVLRREACGEGVEREENKASERGPGGRHRRRALGLDLCSAACHDVCHDSSFPAHHIVTISDDMDMIWRHVFCHEFRSAAFPSTVAKREMPGTMVGTDRTTGLCAGSHLNGRNHYEFGWNGEV